MEGKDGGKTWEEKDQDPDRDPGPRRPETERAAGATAGKELGGGARDFPGPSRFRVGRGGGSTWCSRLGWQPG